MRRAVNVQRRPGFTLVELLVSFALILFIMTILSEAFGAAAKTFRALKAVGDMNKKLRIFSNMIRRDLAADHFEGRKRLSDPNFWANGPPTEGYFRIYQDANPTGEGYDLDNVWSYQSVHQILQFASRFRGNDRDAYYVGTVSTNAPAPLAPTSNGADTRFEDLSIVGTNLYEYRFPWAEIAYFLRPQVNPSGGAQDAANGQPLFSLYRRHWLAAPDFSALSGPVLTASLGSYLEVSCMTDPDTTHDPGALYFNSAMDLTEPPRRMGTKTATGVVLPFLPYSPSKAFPGSSTLLSIPTLAEDAVSTGTTSPLTGSDLLVTDVISFDVRVLLTPGPASAPTQGTEFVSVNDATVQAFKSNNPNYNGATGPYLFDTWSKMTDNVYDFSNWAPGATGVNNTIPIYQNASGQLIGIRAVQVTLRIWDFKTEQTRQVTVVQDL